MYSNGNLAIYDSNFTDSQFGLWVDGGNAYVKNSVAENNAYGFYIFEANAVIEDSVARANSAAGFYMRTNNLSLIRDEAVQNAVGLNTVGGFTEFAYCNIAQNTTAAIEVVGGTVTGASPGTSVVSGAVSGMLGTAVTLQ